MSDPTEKCDWIFFLKSAARGDGEHAFYDWPLADQLWRDWRAANASRFDAQGNDLQEQAWAAGITGVVAAGNGGRPEPGSITNGYGTIEVPGNDPLAITVGAMNTEGTATRADDLMTSYSSKGPTMGDSIVKPDLVAPGNLIFSLNVPGDTLELRGTPDIRPELAPPAAHASGTAAAPARRPVDLRELAPVDYIEIAPSGPVTPQ